MRIPDVFAVLPPTVTEPLNTALPTPEIEATFSSVVKFLKIHPLILLSSALDAPIQLYSAQMPYTYPCVLRVADAVCLSAIPYCVGAVPYNDIPPAVPEFPLLALTPVPVIVVPVIVPLNVALPVL